ncbi:MAG: hypothetical protein U0350_23840 [Caldilineaceae bacterium]
MSQTTLIDLQASIQDRSAFRSLADYFKLGEAFLQFTQALQPTRIISPSHHNYIFYQYDVVHHHRITRPLNVELFIESTNEFKVVFERFITFLNDLRQHQAAILDDKMAERYIASNEINKAVYTIQQSIGCVGDSFDNSNQARKRIGQLFETLVKLIIQEVGLQCEPRTINIPIPGYPGYEMAYELDVVFSHQQAIVAAETQFIHAGEIVGSVKTTSKDRIDKIFLDKYLLTKLLGRNVPVVAIFLHDVQRARRGNSIFGINSTFKSDHFLGYTVALNRLDGVYYVDPRPSMLSNERLRQQISDFQRFLVKDLWRLSSG